MPCKYVLLYNVLGFKKLREGKADKLDLYNNMVRGRSISGYGI